MTLGEQLRWWGLGFLILCLFMWLLADALLPFFLGAAIAYLSDPFADRLERAGLSRLMATVVITTLAIGVGVVALFLIVPALVEQVRDIIEGAPRYVAQARALLDAWVPELSDEESTLRNALDGMRGRLESWSVAVVEKLWSGGLAVIDFVTLVFITPVVAFYLLYDWDRIVAQLDDVTPREHQSIVHRLARELDDVLAGFIRGQLTVCLVLGTFYAAALSAIGLQFGLLVGAFAGLISFIPFVGSILGGAISIGIAVAQFWGDPQWILAVAVVFGIGQVVEGNYLTPKLVGGHVKLHPVWLMFALSAFGALMGFAGLLIAVPAAAAIGVLVRFLLEQYKTGRLYQGSAEWQAAREAAGLSTPPGGTSPRETGAETEFGPAPSGAHQDAAPRNTGPGTERDER